MATPSPVRHNLQGHARIVGKYVNDYLFLGSGPPARGHTHRARWKGARRENPLQEGKMRKTEIGSVPGF
jgi:hypothetical protein